MLRRALSIFSPDSINPIIVKEVRQGNRSKAFLLNFMLAQAAMVFFVIGTLSNASQGSMGQVRSMNAIFWSILGFFLLVGVPLSGINAINQERAEARLDLLHLTRLSAMGIVRGKWLALVAQSLLITSSIVPYVVVRYYFGSVNFFDDLQVIAVLLGISIFVTGLSVSLSSIKSLIFRLLIVGLCLGFFWVVLQGSVVYHFTRDISGSSDRVLALFVFISEGALLLAMAMEFGAASISPPAENHQTRVRLLYLLQLALLGGYLRFADEQLAGMIAVLSTGLGCVVIASALVQRPVALPSIYQPFVRFGVFGRRVGYFLLYPGYPSGFYFTVFCVSVMSFFYYLLMVDHTGIAGAFMILAVPPVLGTFFAPMALALAMPNDRVALLTRFVGMNFIMLLLAILSLFSTHAFGVAASYFFVLIPLCNLFAMINQDAFLSLNGTIYCIGSTITVVLSTWYMFRKGRAWRTAERSLEEAAMALEAGRAGNTKAE